MKKLLPLLLLVSTSALAVQEYYAVTRSIRALGMGGAYYALSDDQYALFYNPAGLATREGGGRFSLLGIGGSLSPSTIDALDTITHSSGKDVGQVADSLSKFQGIPLYVGASPTFLTYYQKHFAIGILLADFKVDMALLGRDLDTQVDATAIADSGIFAAYATSFVDDTLHVGLTAKAMGRAGGRKLFSLTDIAQKNGFELDPNKLGGAGAGLDFDLGASYDIPLPKTGPFLLYRASFVINNLLANDYSMVHITGGAPPQLPRTVSLGGYTALKGVGPIENFHIVLDLAEFNAGGQEDPEFGARKGSFFKHLNFGVEAPLWGHWITPRLGFHQGYITAGLGFDLRALKIDFATYGEELAAGVGRLGSRRYALRLELGWGNPPPAITGKPSEADKIRDFKPTDKEMEPPPVQKPAPPVVEPNKVEPVDPTKLGEPPAQKPGDKDVPLLQEQNPKPEAPPKPQGQRKPQSEGVEVPADGNAPAQEAFPTSSPPEEVTIPR